MRKTFLTRLVFLITILLSFFSEASATHVQGGEITMTCLGGNQYRIRLALYRDCAGVAAPTTVSVNYKSVSCGRNLNVTLNRIPGTGVEVAPICPTSATQCNGGSNPGVQEYIYQATVTLPAACTDWVFSYSLAARNNAINTINSPGSQNMYIESRIDNLNYPCNNSPTFTNKPVPFICVGQQYCFNNGATDADGDSLSYSMVAPLHNATTPVTYLAGYSATQPLVSVPGVTINPATGDICMTPTMLQVTVFAVLVNEWRNGVLIGQIRRDIQIRTITCNNTNPFLNGINNTGVYSMSACAGNPINFNIPSFDNDAANSVTLSWNGGIPGATFTPGTGSRPTANFSWTPTQANISTVPQCFTVSAVDNNCPYFGSQSYSFCITVGGFTTTTTSTNVLCNNADGTASVQVQNPIDTYNYLWSPGGQTTSSLTGLAAGNYSVTTSDAVGCSVVNNITISSTDPSLASITSFNNVTCNGASNGSITASLTGAGVTGPLSYAWTPAVAGNVNTATNLAPGSYSVIITDSKGCVDTATQVITQPTPISPNTNFVNVGCFGESTGIASASPTGGTPGYTYLWMPGALNTATISSLPIGTYTVTVSDNNNCTANSSVTISQPPALDITSVVTNSNCGQADGSATVTGSGGFAPYTWSWSNGQTGTTATGLSAGTYSVTQTDMNFCTKTISVSVGNNVGPTVQVSNVTNVSCFGGNNGSISVTVSGGTAPFTYLWSNGQTTATASNLTPGTYSITITDANGCSAVTNGVITQPTALSNNFITTNPICFGQASGSITANPLGGTPPYTYLWSVTGNPTTQTVTGLLAGSYSVTITDALGCSIIRNVTLTNPPTVTTVINKTDVSCFSGCDGTATAVVSNGTNPISYSWNDPLNQTSATANFLCSGSYQVNIIDGNGCTSQAVTTINQPTQLNTALASKGDLVCFEECIGFAQVTASGGTPPYSYAWSNGNTTATATNLCAGTHSCTVTDSKGCTSIFNVTITQPSKLVATITGTDIKCFGTCDGTGNISFSGGTAPYSFLWTPGYQTIENPIDLCVGQNIAEITDFNGCKVTDTITLTEAYSPLTAVQNISNANCGQATGSACVTPSGGLAPYSYIWNNPSVSNTDCISNEFAGTYSVDITDAVGCLRTEVVNINDIAAPTVTITSHTNLLCYNDSNATATTNIVGGVPPYTILWAPGNQTIQNPTNLLSGMNTITVTDTAGCTSSASVNILRPTDINAAITSSTNVSCFNLCDGTATVAASGGTGTLSFSWNNPSAQTTTIANGLCAGDYSVTIKDENNCTKIRTITITQPAALVIDSNNTSNLLCFEDNTGSIYTSVSGGTPFYTYNWTPSISTTSTATNLAAGNYSLQVTDQKGCTTNQNWIITEPALLTGTTSSIDAKCSSNNGSATITPTGGTTPYFYQWNDPLLQNTSTANNLYAGSYQVIITDNNNCIFTQDYNLLDSPGPIIDSVSSTPVSCFGGADGTALVSLIANTGTPPFTYDWNPGTQSLQNISGLTAGNYTVLVTDSNGCVASGNISVEEPTQLELFASQSDTICYGDTIQIYGQGSGGTQPYSYTWLGASNLNQTATNSVSPTTTTTYTVGLTDFNGCTVDPVNIQIVVRPQISVVATDTMVCDGESAEIKAVVSGGNGGPYTYSWSNGISTQNQTVLPDLASSPNNYVITVNDGCSSPAYDTATVIVNSLPTIDSINVSNVLCYGQSNGFATVYLNSSAQPPFIFDWGFVSQSNPLVTGLSVGEYIVNVTDNYGCKSNDTIMVTQPEQLVLTVVGDSICYGATGQVSASASGGTTPYTYTWTGITGVTTGSGPHSVSPLVTTTYTVSVLDSNNCSINPTNVQVKVGEPLSVQATDATACEDETALISSSGSGGGASSYQYSWSNGINTASQTVTVQNTNTYFIVTLNDGCSTPATDTSFVTINLKPTASILALPTNGCVPLTVDFIAISNNGTQYYWNYGVTSSVVGTLLDTTRFVYNTSGTYDVSLTVVNLAGCSTLVSNNDYIHVYPNPVANFTMNPNPTSILDTYVEFTDLSYSNINSWQWNFAGLGSSTSSSPNYTFPDVAGDYPISLLVTNSNGCVDSITKTLIIKPEWGIYVPNAFTPDEDDVNDGFGPNGFGISEKNYGFYVFDRWGEKIFETHKLFETWDGTYKGNIVQQDVYVWKLEFKDIHGVSHTRIGHVTLIK